MVQEDIITLEEVHECMCVESILDKNIRPNTSFLFLLMGTPSVTKNRLDIVFEWIASGLLPKSEIEKFILQYPKLESKIKEVGTNFDLKSSYVLSLLQSIRASASKPEAGSFEDMLTQLSSRIFDWPSVGIEYLRAAAIRGFLSGGHIQSAEALLPETNVEVRQTYALTDSYFSSLLETLNMIPLERLAESQALQDTYKYAREIFLLEKVEVDELVSQNQVAFNKTVKQSLIQDLTAFIATKLWKHQKSRFAQFVADCEIAPSREQLIELLLTQSAVQPSFGMKDAILGIKEIVDECLIKLGIDPASSPTAKSPAASAADRFSQSQESALQKQSVFVTFAAKVKQTFSKQSNEEKLAAMEQRNDDLFQL